MKKAHGGMKDNLCVTRHPTARKLHCGSIIAPPVSAGLCHYSQEHERVQGLVSQLLLCIRKEGVRDNSSSSHGTCDMECVCASIESLKHETSRWQQPHATIKNYGYIPNVLCFILVILISWSNCEYPISDALMHT